MAPSKSVSLLFCLATASTAFTAVPPAGRLGAAVIHQPSAKAGLAALRVLETARANKLTRLHTEADASQTLLKVRGGASVSLKKVAAPVTEAVGTGILTAVVAILGSPALGLSASIQGLAAGAVLMSLIYSGAHISGANFNPMVSFALMVLGKMDVSQGLTYVASQVLGATGGAFLARSLIGGLADPTFAVAGAGVLPELVFSFGLAFAVLQTAVAKAQAGNSNYGLAIGSMVAVGATLGASMNPAVAAGLFAAAGTTGGLLARWALPLLAAIPATLVYKVTTGDGNAGVLSKLSKFVAMETVGTYLLTSAVIMALVTGNIAAPLAAGLMLTSLAFSGGFVSGSHVNPAVTLGVSLRDRSFGSGKVVRYALSQILGAFAAALAASYAFGSGATAGLLPLPQKAYGLGQVFGAEAFGTFLLVSTVLNNRGSLGGLAVSSSLMVGLLAAGPISGGGLNPAVALALSLVNGAKGQLSSLWVYLTAPLVGAASAYALTEATSDKLAIA